MFCCYATKKIANMFIQQNYEPWSFQKYYILMKQVHE